MFGSAFWETYPYALPLLVCAVYQFLTSLLACAVLRDAPRTAAYDAVGAASATSAPVWRRRGPLLSCAAYALLAGAQILFDELFPLYARGCLEWKPPRIGRFLALGGGSLLIGSFAARPRPPAVERQRVAGLRVLQSFECALGCGGAGAVVLRRSVPRLRVAARDADHCVLPSHATGQHLGPDVRARRRQWTGPT